MIIAGGKTTGSKLLNVIVHQLRKSDSVDVAVVSERGANQINKVGQLVANKLGRKVSADPRQDEVQIDGKRRLALIITLTVQEEK